MKVIPILRFRPSSLAAIWLALVPTFASAQTPAPADPAPVREVQPAETRLRFYGFVRADLIFDDSRMDSAQSPLFVLSERAGAEDRANFTMHPRLTRFGIDLLGPEVDALGNARASGRIEMDFQNGGRESRATPRFRHAFATLTWRSASLLVGQTTDIISPLFPSVNADTLMWNAGNLGDRRAQVRGTVTTGKTLQWSFTGGIGLTGAVDHLDMDEDGIRDGEASGRPNVQGRAVVSYPVGTRRLALGVWGHHAKLETTTAMAGHNDFDSHVLGIDAEIPLGRRFVVRGEAWTGSNLSDIRGGIGQAVNRTTGRSIDSRGGWIEAGGDLTPRYAVFAGLTTDRPDSDDLPQGGRSRNGAWYIVNRFNAGRPFVVGADYLRWQTEFVGLPDGTNNRVNVYVIYNF